MPDRISTIAVNLKERPDRADAVLLTIAARTGAQPGEAGMPAHEDRSWLSRGEVEAAFQEGTGRLYRALLRHPPAGAAAAYWRCSTAAELFERICGYVAHTNPAYTTAARTAFRQSADALQSALQAGHTAAARKQLVSFERAAWEAASVAPDLVAETLADLLTLPGGPVGPGVHGVLDQIRFLRFRLRLPETDAQLIRLVCTGYHLSLQLEVAQGLLTRVPDMSGKPAADALVDLVHDQRTDPGLREAVLGVLARHLAHTEAQALLTEALAQDCAESVRLAAVDLLCQHFGNDLAFVWPALRDPAPEVREAIVAWLDASTYYPERLQYLFVAYHAEPDPRVRRQIVTSLGGARRHVIGEADARLERLLQQVMMQDPFVAVRAAALQQLEPSRNAAVREQIHTVLQLAADEESQIAFLRAVGMTNDPDIIRWMLQRLEAPSTELVRGVAAEALTFQGRFAVGALRQALQDDSDFVRAKAAEALGRMRTTEALDVLLAVLETTSPYDALALVEAIGHYGPEARAALPRIRWYAKFPDIDLQRGANRALERIEEP